MEKLLSVKQDSHYDLIVLDTPPTSNALDFLDAPERITEAIDSAAMRWFIQAFESSGKFSLNLVAKSVALVLRGIGKLTGGGFLEQMAEFITELNDLFGGFKSRAAEVAKAFRSTEFAYVLVTSPAPMAIREVLFFAERLHDQGMARDAFVVNRVHRAPRSVATEGEVEAALAQHGIRLGQDAPARLVRAVSEEQSLAELDRSHLSRLDGALANNPDGSPPTRVNIPALPSDVHDISTLAGISRLLAPGS